MSNKHGLSRHIPEKIKREIRRRSKFGCVNCRSAFYQYEHILPEYKDAAEHDPENMCLLCGHCHHKVTIGALSKKTIQEKYEYVQNNDDIKRPFDEFDLTNEHLSIKLGGCNFEFTQKLIVLDGVTVLSINPPEAESAFPTISGVFTDRNGIELFTIVNNEWQGPDEAGDLELKGNEIIIRDDEKRVIVHLRANPPDSIEVVELDLRVKNSHLLCRENEFCIGRIAPEEEYYLCIGQLVSRGAEVGVMVDEENIKFPNYQGLSIVAGKGIDLKGTGVKVAINAGQMNIKDLKIEHADKYRTLVTHIPLRVSLEATVEELPSRL